MPMQKKELFGRIKLTNIKDNEALCGGLIRAAATGDNADMHVQTIETMALHDDVRIRIAVLAIRRDEK